MGGLLRESHPYLVLLGSFGSEDGKHGDNGKYQYYSQRPIRVIGQAFQHDRLVVAHLLVVASQFYLDDIASLFHLLGIGLCVSRILDVAVVHYVVFRVEHDDRYGVVAFHHLCHQ